MRKLKKSPVFIKGRHIFLAGPVDVFTTPPGEPGSQFELEVRSEEVSIAFPLLKNLIVAGKPTKRAHLAEHLVGECNFQEIENLSHLSPSTLHGRRLRLRLQSCS